MKLKILLLYIAIISPIFCFSQNRKFDKLINKYDVFPYIQNLKKGDANAFWEAVFRNDKSFNALYQAVKKKKSSAMTAISEVNKAEKLADLYCSSLDILSVGEWGQVDDSIVKFLGIHYVSNNVKVYIVHTDELNAFTRPNGSIYMADTLFLTEALNLSGVMGIAAHEATHFLLQHSLSQSYETEKKLRTNKTIASIAAGIDIAANAYAQANGGATSDSWQTIEENNNSLYEEAEYNAKVRFRYKYSREEEVQSDIVAYRFLEFMGYNAQDYINALKFIGGNDNSLKASETSTHPTTMFRIKLLEYLASKNK